MRFAREKPKEPEWGSLESFSLKLREGDLVLNDKGSLFIVDEERSIVNLETGESIRIADAYGDFQIVTDLYEIRKVSS